MTAAATGLVADGPIEADGIHERSDVRLLVATPDGLLHRRVADLPDVLRAGDLLVVNTSATVPAAVGVSGRPDEVVHLSGRMPDGTWLVEPRRICGRGSVPHDVGEAGGDIPVPGAALRLRERFQTSSGPSRRLWVAALDVAGRGSTDDVVHRWLLDVGRPIRYGCTSTAWPLAAYQTVFATVPGSAEMPSAARPFTDRLVTRLVAAGVEVAPLVLHTGVSSLERGEPPYPESFAVPPVTAARVNAARADGRRVIAVGTTVVRALESAVTEGRVRGSSGWTDLVVTPERPAEAIDGLLTGWHEPEATHVDLLRAVAGTALVDASYEAARRDGYRWHEFGDSHLLLPA